jgi:ABC-2 type transport system ATP-binding protein
MSLAIETNHLGKRFRHVTAVEGLSLQVKRGEIYAFLGLNGAGKTTTIRMLLGLIRPTNGEAHMLGTRIQTGRNGPWGSVGYMVETPHAYPELTVRENLEAARRLRPGVPPQAVDLAIGRMGLGEFSGRITGTLSHGNYQRLGLAKALLHQPELLILDEPANGLDPAGIVEIRELLLEQAHQHGVTVFMSSHILAEVTRLADRVGIIHQGRLVQEMDMTEMERDRCRRLILRTLDNAKACAVLNQSGMETQLSPSGDIFVLTASAIDHPDRVAVQLVQADCPPTMLRVEVEDLEDYFLRLLGLQKGAGP